MWETLLSEGLAAAGKGANSIANDRKSAYWKINGAFLFFLLDSARNSAFYHPLSLEARSRERVGIVPLALTVVQG